MSMRFLKGPLILTAIAATGMVFTTSPAPSSEKKDRLSAADFEKLHTLIKPAPGESRWMEIDWHPTVWEARQKAAKEGKPLFIWAGSGGAPAAGC
jgi:hypothetical protein